MKDYKQEYKKWLDSDYLAKEDKEILKNMSKQEIVSSFSSEIDFGTGGIRALMGQGINRLNVYTVNKVSKGLAFFLQDNLNLITQYNLNKSVVIAYDNRKNSKTFCLQAAKVFASFGFKTYIFDSLRTTPELSFAITYLRCMAGVMITASHNPKEYNGYKVYNHFGGQLINSEATEVKKYIQKIDEYLDTNFDFDKSLIITLDGKIDNDYYKMCVDTCLLQDDFSKLKVVYSPSHGTGLVAVSKTLQMKKANLFLVEEQSYPSETFENTKSPNPEDRDSYELGLNYLIKNKADILFVTDPDCDRVGACILDNNYKPFYISGNQMGLLLTDFILNIMVKNNKLNKKSSVVSTKVSSAFIKKLVNSYGVIFREVFTGFKNIASTIINEDIDFVFGFEESYGYLKNPIVKDKDAVQACLLICEMVNYYKKDNISLLDKLDEIFDKYGKVFDSQYNLTLKDNPSLKEEIMNKAYNFSLKDIAGYKVKEVLNYNIGLNITTNTKIETGDNLVKIVFEDDSFICVRPSGTEPKVKTYYSIFEDKNNPNKELMIKYCFLNYLNPNLGHILFCDGPLVERIWGGNYFKDVLKLTNDDTKYGELWSLSGYKGYESNILNKEYNTNLSSFYKENRHLFNDAKEEDFPILVKIIATTDKLSVQVHPDDEYARIHEGGQGKNECWLILYSQEDSELVIGHNAKNKTELIKNIKDKSYDKLLKNVSVKPGDFYPIPSGTIHAIGKNIVLLEVQQTSNLTYRFYDYDRLGMDNKPRELHVQKAVDVTDFNPYQFKNINCFKNKEMELWNNKYFKVEYKEIEGLALLNNPTFQIVSVIDGFIYINDTRLTLGNSCVICSDVKQYLIGGKGKIVVTTYNKS